MRINLDQVLQDLIKKEPLYTTDIDPNNIMELGVHIGEKIEKCLCKNCTDEVNKLQDIKKDEVYTLRVACRDAVATSYNPEIFPSEKNLKPKEVQARYRLWQKVDANKEGELLEVEKDEFVILVDLAGQYFRFKTLLLGQVLDMLEDTKSVTEGNKEPEVETEPEK